MKFVTILVEALWFNLLVFAILTSLEIFFRRGEMSVRDRARGLQIWAVYIPLQILVVMSALSLIRWLGVKPLITIPIGLSGIPGAIAATLLGFLLADLAFYWGHRAQHRFFWRWHSVHHSIRNLSAINSYHHWSEAFFNVAFTIVPLSLIDMSETQRVVVISVVLSAQPFLIHAPTSLHLGPLSRVICDNRYHRIHHSLEPQHLERNFGALTPLWDWLFGTAYFPAKDEWPDVGIPEHPEPKTIRDWSAIPFRHQREATLDTAPVKSVPLT